MQLLYKNERYGLNNEKEEVLRRNNTEFEQISSFKQLFKCQGSSVTTEKKEEGLTTHEDFQLSARIYA